VRIRIQSGYSSHLFGLAVESDHYKQFIKTNLSGSAQPQANAQVLTSLPIVRPPESLQTVFTEIVEPMLDQKEVLELKNANLRRTRDLLLPRLISGALDASKLDIETA
jgi:type I restriction enzyme S subunit